MSHEPFRLGDLFGFERLLAPRLLKLIYWIGLALITLGMLRALIWGPMMHSGMMGEAVAGGFSLGRVIGVLVAYVVIIVLWRVLIEAYYAFFGIYTRLGEIRDRLGDGSA